MLITLESALSGAYLFRGQDGVVRDLTSLHGTYRQVEETEPALELLRDALDSLEPENARWLIDATRIDAGPVARIPMPLLPIAFHGIGCHGNDW